MFLRFMPHAVAGVLVVAGTLSAQAAPVLIDDFNRATGGYYQTGPNTVAAPGKNWVELEAQDSDVAILRYPSPSNGVLQLRDYRSGLPDAQATLYGVVIPDELINITISYQYLGHDTDANDLLYVQWKRDGESTWTTVGTHALSSSNFQTASFALPDDVTKIDLRFWTDVTDTISVQEKDQQVCVAWRYGRCKEYKWTYKTVQKPASHDQTAKIDNIYYSGDIRDPAPEPTPIPGALPLFMSGAAVFGGLVYRRKRKQQPAA